MFAVEGQGSCGSAKSPAARQGLRLPSEVTFDAAPHGWRHWEPAGTFDLYRYAPYQGFHRETNSTRSGLPIEKDDITTCSSCVNGDRLAMRSAIRIVQVSNCWLGQTRLCLTL